MAEKEGRNKPTLVRRILRWVGITLLALLLAAGIIFQAPWKVITLLCIFLAACTILPKPARKWFWLGVGVIVLALVIWVFLPDETEGWRPYTFDDELAAIEAKRAVPPDEDAAIIYDQLLEDYDQAAFEPNFIDPNLHALIRKEPWSSQDYPEVAQWLKQHEVTIATLLEASKKENCCFPIAANTVDLSKQMDRLSPMRRWAFLLLIAGNNDIAEKRIDQTLEKQIAVLQMAKHLCQQPPLIDFLVGAALEALSTEQLKRFIVTGDATEEHLSVIEGALAEIKHDWSYDFPKFLEHEKLFSKNFWGMFYAINPEGKIRLNPGVARMAMMAQLPEDTKDELVITYWHKRLMKTGTILCWFYMPSTPEKAGEIIDASYEKLYAMAEPDFDWEQKPKHVFQFFTHWNFTKMHFNFRYAAELLADMAAGTYYGVHDLYLRTIAVQRGTGIMIALRRYKNKNGHWPESLDELKFLAPEEIFIDPINNDSFVYKLTEDNFTLYSKGKNNIDEGGKRDRCSEEQTGADDRLIWPPRKCNAAKGENSDEQR